jgi:pyruvate formate lyase activating enzyme
LIFDIARGSLEDGPGIRTVVFLKGCPLRCPWCQNPESQSPDAQTLFNPENCIDCGACRQGGECNSLARRTAGSYYPPDELAQLILRDRVFYETSQGGATFSGGEPLLFIDFIYEVARLIKKEKIHIVVETSGYFNYPHLEKKLLPLIDLFFFDIKIMDPGKHIKYTGKSNRLIIRNFERLIAAGAAVLPRIPLIPGFTANKENLAEIADFFIRHHIKEYALLPYNPSGLDKWRKLGAPPPANISPEPMSLLEEQKWSKFFKKRLQHL